MHQFAALASEKKAFAHALRLQKSRLTLVRVAG
jgi:hypothetical protein